MSAGFERVTTRMRAFVEGHGFDPGQCESVPVDELGVTVLHFGRTGTSIWAAHPWWRNTGSRADYPGYGPVRVLYAYPDPQTRDEALRARDEDWAETIGPDHVRQLALLRATPHG